MTDASEQHDIPDCPGRFAGLHAPVDEHGNCPDCDAQIVDPDRPKRQPNPPRAPWTWKEHS